MRSPLGIVRSRNLALVKRPVTRPETPVRQTKNRILHVLKLRTSTVLQRAGSRVPTQYGLAEYLRTPRYCTTHRGPARRGPALGGRAGLLIGCCRRPQAMQRAGQRMQTAASRQWRSANR